MKKLSLALTIVLAVGIAFTFTDCRRELKVITVEVLPTEDKSQFVNITDVVPDAILEIRSDLFTAKEPPIRSKRQATS